MERLMVILFLSALITVVKTSSTASKEISMQTKCLVNQKKKKLFDVLPNIPLPHELPNDLRLRILGD